MIDQVGSLAKLEVIDLSRVLGGPCGPVLSVPEALGHPHAAHRDMIVIIVDYRGIGSPIKLSRTPAIYRKAQPKLCTGGRSDCDEA
jgi:crotonobetainyl-CoA:carnitine CoA-transferase CaiB-like acyl-CoA transferase